jgi:hypothetical protein
MRPAPQGRPQDGTPVCPSALAEHAVQDLPESRPLVLAEIREQHAGDGVAVQHPVPHLLPRAERWPLGRADDANVMQPGIGQPSATWNSSGGGSSGRPGNSGATAVSAPMKNCRNSSSAGEP